jgi:hypothetical protein
MLQVFDIFSFLILLLVSFFIRNKKSKGLLLLVLSFFLVSVSAFFFTTEYMSVKEYVHNPLGPAAAVMHYDLYIVHFILTWMVYFYLPYLMVLIGVQDDKSKIGVIKEHS